MTGGHENMDPQKILDYGAKLIVIFMCIPIRSRMGGNKAWG